jgi:hypothetical protein
MVYQALKATCVIHLYVIGRCQNGTLRQNFSLCTDSIRMSEMGDRVFITALS